MADLARPALPEVLAALTGSEPDAWSFDRRRVLGFSALGPVYMAHGSMGFRDGRSWTTTDPVEAAELLVTRDVLPAGWCGDTRRGWACPVCGGKGVGPSWGGSEHCGACYRGLRARPSTIPDLVAVASLGWPAIQRAEELARAACHALREYGCPQPRRVVWRVGKRGAEDAVLWRDSIYNFALVSVRGVLRVYPNAGPIVPVLAIDALWTSGLALDAITPDAAVVVVPPVGGPR